MKPTSLLARLFGRANPPPLVAQLFSNAIGQPLLVHPQMGEQLISGYLHGAVDARPPALTIGELAPGGTDAATGVVTDARNVAIINVSGGLVNRFEPGLCDPGPLSYVELRAVFDRAMADTTVEAIVLRLESPGGMASGMFDLSDHIHASRGSKPIIGCIDDYAYSAAYGLAAACDEIWITRTGGAGSVGVTGYHVDQSRAEANMGLVVTQIFSGAHKADMSPHAPLSDDARAWMQERMHKMRGMFAASVAKYRGMELDAVLATEAQVYQGEDAVAVGFADRIGTFAELMQQLAAGWTEDAEAMAEERKPEDDAQAGAVTIDPDAAKFAADLAAVEALAKTAADAVAADAALAKILHPVQTLADFTAAVTASTLPPAVAMALLKRGPKDQAAADAISYATSVRDACFAAGLESCAPDYITQNKDLATVRAQLLAARAESGPEIVTTHPEKSSSAPSLSSVSVYESRRRAASASTST